MQVKTFSVAACILSATAAIGSSRYRTPSVSHWVNPLARMSSRDIRSTENPHGPHITARSAIIIDANSGKILWSKNPLLHVYPASTTKIMTALLLIKNFAANQVLTAPPGINKVGGSSLHLRPGEKITALNLLYALMLRSANDGCVTVAYNLAGSVPAFVKMMNAEAYKLGCHDIHFDNPNGLPDPKHWVTAEDMAIIARYDMRFPIFRQVVKTIHHHIVRSIDTRDEYLTNTDRWLQYDPTADGIKTGWTVAAGHCFIGSATRDGFRVIDVEYHSNNWIQDHKRMLAWAFAHFDHTPVPAPPSKKLALHLTSFGQVPCHLAEPLSAIHRIGTPETQYHFQINQRKLPGSVISKDEILGNLKIYTSNNHLVGEDVLLANTTASPKAVAKKSKEHEPYMPLSILGVGLIGGMIYVKSTRKKNFSHYWRSMDRH